MSGNKLLLDTNIVLYLLGDEHIEDQFSGKQLAVSVITEIELLSYPQISIAEEQVIIQFLDTVRCIELTDDIKAETVILRRKYKLRLPDAIICATAKVYNLTLITNDLALRKVDEVDILGLDEM